MAGSMTQAEWTPAFGERRVDPMEALVLAIERTDSDDPMTKQKWWGMRSRMEHPLADDDPEKINGVLVLTVPPMRRYYADPEDSITRRWWLQ